ncbi:MAG: TOBE domain-containing protein [Pseudomonadota bacterium]
MMESATLQLSTPNNIYDDPIDLRVAEFIGSPKINTLPGAVDAEGRVSAAGLVLQRRALSTAGSVTVAIRPEHLEPAAASAGNAVSVRLVHLENLGADVFVHGVVERAGPAKEQRLVARALPEIAQSFEVGQDARFALTRGEAMVFGADDQRIPLEPPSETAAQTGPETAPENAPETMLRRA